MDTSLEKHNIFRPEILNLYNLDDQDRFNELCSNKTISICDEIYYQLKELIKCLNPSINVELLEYEKLISHHLKEINIYKYGVWVYYPWNNKLIHLLDQEEFVKVRTNRNQLKITKEEQKILSTKIIGIVGLSVGQSIALTIAIERVCGELRLADFDTVELSNLNRIRTPVYNLGLKKTIIVAREIAEIDPFIKIKIFNEGLISENIDEFFINDRTLDLLVEVCDGIDMKILSRYKARDLKIPVVMDTNDRGMLDIERFDIEPNRNLFHGLIGTSKIDINNITPIERLEYIFKIVNVEKISSRLKDSMIEIGKSLNTWPQLASSTVLGGALVTDVVRKILLNHHNESGRYYVDLDELLSSNRDI